jgi:hypothetical protein
LASSSAAELRESGTANACGHGFRLSNHINHSMVVGETNGADFPTTLGAYQPGFNEPSATINRGWDAFVTRFNASGSAMVFSTYLGAAPIFDPNQAGSSRGGRREYRAVVFDHNTDSVIVSRYTTSENFPPLRAPTIERTRRSP